MEQSISVTLPVIRKAIFTLDIDYCEEFFSILEYPFNETINRADDLNDITDEIDVFIKEERINKFKEEIVSIFIQMFIYSDYGKCQCLRGFFDFLESLITDELLIEGVDEVDTTSEDFEMPSSASTMLHFLYYMLNTVPHEDHIRITQIFSDINVVDELGLDIDIESLSVNLSNDQIRLLMTVEIQ